MEYKELQSIQNLLAQVSLISNKYEEIAKHTGENYNIFHILGSTSDELAHSRIIGDLLNPKGVHGLGDVFLKEFLSILEINDFETQNAKLEIEKHIGFTNDDYSEGGRIDLFLTNGYKEIVIENKIYAGDQELQLERYHNKYSNARILYLTLDGSIPRDISLGKLKVGDIINDKVKLVSYKEKIKLWLENSIKYAVNFPLLRETITQYLNLIKHLTGLARNNDMKNELKKIILSNQMFFENIELLSNIKKEIVNDLEVKLINSLKLKTDSLIAPFVSDKYLFIFDIQQDVDGLFFGIKAINVDSKVQINPNSDDVLKHYANRLKANYIDFSHHNENYIGWITPLGKKMMTAHLSSDKIIEFSNSDEKFNLYIEELSIQCVNFVEVFKNVIHSNSVYKL